MRIFLALPTYDQRIYVNTMMSALHCRQNGDPVEVYPYPVSGSLLPRVFNEALATAVVRGYDRLCMMHADVIAEPGWITKLHQVAEEYDADVLSCVVALKDERQLSSTAVTIPGQHPRKLSLHECQHSLPTTFDINAPYLQKMGATELLLNTGLMFMRLDRPWLRRWSGFRIRSRILWSDEEVTVDTLSEDWDMSRVLAAMEPAPRLLATTAVRVHHWGMHLFDNVPLQPPPPPAPPEGESGSSRGAPAAERLLSTT